jgi:hypothetical protein
MASEARISQQAGISYNGTLDKYVLKSYTYPENLFSNKAEFGNTWVMININVLEQSKYFKQDQSVELSPEEQGKRWTQADARDQSTLAASTSAAISSGVLAAGASLISTLASKGKISGVDAGLASKGKISGVDAGQAGKAGLIAGGTTGLVVGVPLAIAGTTKRSTKRLASAIQLPMPNNIATPYAVEWGGEDTAGLDALMRVPGMLLPGGNKASSPAGDKIQDAAAAAALAAGKAAGAGGVSAAAGLVVNPKREMMFTGVDFRNFTMDYMFYPKNMAEARYVKNIVDLLKFHMYPEYKSSERFTYVYPSEFDITFYMGDGKENPWVNRIATSVLTSMNVNYTPQGVWATHADGSPVMIQVSLAFKELSIITKENLLNPADDSTEIKASY